MNRRHLHDPPTPGVQQSSSALDPVERERARIAADLHDGIGQALTGLKLDVAWLSRRFAELRGQNPAIGERLKEMEAFISTTSDDLKRICHDLRPGALQYEGLSLAVELLARQWAKRAGLNAYVDVNLDGELSDHQATAVIRVAQEALANIVKHAYANAVWVSLDQTNGWLHLQIRDNGIGLHTPLPLGEGAGLANMRERAHGLHGQLEIFSPPEGGTVVHLQIPLSN